MNKIVQNKAVNNRKNRVRILFALLVLAMLLFLASILKTISSQRRIPSAHTTIHDRAFRGAIISADNYTLSNSKKYYQAVVRGASIKPEKKELFIKLFLFTVALMKINYATLLLTPKVEKNNATLFSQKPLTQALPCNLKHSP
jgi:hypothetical protein